MYLTCAQVNAEAPWKQNPSTDYTDSFVNLCNLWIIVFEL